MAGESPWIFPSSRNPGRHLARVNNAHDRLCVQAQKAGIALDLRHTFATRMAEEGIDLATLAKILGHNSIRIVERWISQLRRKMRHSTHAIWRRIIRAAMIDKAHLRDKQVLFRLLNAGVYSGVVRFVENDGFWIDSPSLIGQMYADQAWKPEVERIQHPVLFVPSSSLMYLIAAKE